MPYKKPIQVYEHDTLKIEDSGFEQDHWKSLIRLNELHNNNYFTIVHNGVKFSQFVGVVQVKGLTIEILPKVDRADSDTNWRKVLIGMLKACKKISADSYGDAMVRRQNLNLLELYFDLFLSEINHLIQLGLVKKYRKETKNVTALKGKIEFTKHLKLNSIHKERFYTTHQVYDLNHLLHNILNEALGVVEIGTRGTYLFDKCKRTQLRFPELPKTRITKQHIEKIKLDRKTAPYKRAFELARFILLNYSPDIAGGKENMISLLFDMNELWEEYILRSLKKAVAGSEIKVSGQESRNFWNAQEPKISKYVIPDIVIEKGEKKYIIDTKWKIPRNRRPGDEDLRQIYVYNLLWKAEKSILLYPKPRTEEVSEIIGSYNHGDTKLTHGFNGELRFLDILDQKGGLKVDLGSEILRALIN